jgi:hypothetical protein
MTSLPKNVIIVALSTLKLLKKIYLNPTSKKKKFIFEMLSKIGADMYELMEMSGLDFSNETQPDYIKNFSEISKTN